MGGEFDSVALGDVATIRSGFAFKSRDWTESGVPVVKIANVKEGSLAMEGCSFVAQPIADQAAEFALQAGDILMAMTGYIGDVALVRDHNLPAVLNQRVGRFSIHDQSRLDQRFLFYLLREGEVRREIEGLGYGSAQPNVSPTLIQGLEVPLPPLTEQRAIAHILGTLDDKIELNRRMSEALEAMARALFKAWFVDFDPVRAKMANRDPGLPQALADLFPARLVDSELGEIPEGWEVGTLGDVAALNPEVWTKQTRPPEINYVDLSNTKWGRIEAVTAYEASDAPSRARRVLRPGDTIIGTVRPGNGSYALISDEGLTGSTGFAVLRPDKPQSAEFVYLASTARENIDALAHLADGGAYPSVRPEVVAATPVVLPGNKVLEPFALASGPLLAKMAQNERESRTLAQLRDTLLPKLISGELRLAKAEKILESAP